MIKTSQVKLLPIEKTSKQLKPVICYFPSFKTFSYISLVLGWTLRNDAELSNSMNEVISNPLDHLLGTGHDTVGKWLILSVIVIV